MLIHAGARFAVRYGEDLRFAGSDLPRPRRLRVPTRHGPVPRPSCAVATTRRPTCTCTAAPG